MIVFGVPGKRGTGTSHCFAFKWIIDFRRSQSPFFNRRLGANSQTDSTEYKPLKVDGSGTRGRGGDDLAPRQDVEFVAHTSGRVERTRNHNEYTVITFYFQ